MKHKVQVTKVKDVSGQQAAILAFCLFPAGTRRLGDGGVAVEEYFNAKNESKNNLSKENG
ncbi:MAG: hypothetical protein ACKVUS_19530 [Saprospiraceae bacterium]